MARSLLVWLGAAGLLALGVAAGARPLEVANGNFERGSTQGWTVINPGGQPCDWRATDEPGRVHSGRWAGVLSRFGGTTDTLELVNGVDVTSLAPATLLKLSFQIRTEGVAFHYRTEWLKSSFMPVLYTLDAQGQVLRRDHGLGYFVGDWDWTPVDVLFNVPHGAARVEVRFELSSALTAGVICLDDFTCEVLDEPPATDAGKLTRTMAEVRRDDAGTPRLLLNGKVEPPLIFFGAPHHPVVYDEMRLARGAGVNLIEIEVLPPWSGMSTAMIEQSLRANPDALLLLRIPVFPPFYWKQAWGWDSCVDEQGQPCPDFDVPTLAEDAFLAGVKEQLATMIGYLQQSPYRDRIIGYHPTFHAGGEWFYDGMGEHFYDYSPTNQRRFARWAQQKYETIGRLNAAWRGELHDFSEIDVPRPEAWERGDVGLFRDPARQGSAVPDYAEYHNALVADRLDELGAHIKSLTGGRALVAFFYGYHNELIGNGGRRGIGHSGHWALRRLLASPNVDILCSPVSYFDRQPGGPANMMAIVESVTRAGKLYLQEDDSRTHLWPNPDLGLGYGTEWDTLQCLRRNFGMVLARNQSIWWMDLRANGNYNSPAIWDNNRRLMEIYRENLEQAIPYAPEVALIYGEESLFWLKSDCFDLTMNACYRQRSVFREAGVTFGNYFIDDLDALPASVRLCVFVNTYRTTPRQDQAIERLKGNGRALLWLYAPGYATPEALSTDHMEKLTGFRLGMDEQPAAARVAIDAATGDAKAAAWAEGLAGHEFGIEESLAPTFHGDPAQPGVETLGHYVGTERPALMLKRHRDWTSIFCGSPVVSVPLLRRIAAEAGCTVMVDGPAGDNSDAIDFNGRFLFVYARERDGPRRLRTPGGALYDVEDALDGRAIGTGIKEWTSEFKRNEQKIFRLKPHQAQATENGDGR